MSEETYPHVFEARTKAGATIDDVYGFEGKAEIVDDLFKGDRRA